MNTYRIILLAAIGLLSMYASAKTSFWDGSTWSTIDITDPKADKHNFILLADYSVTTHLSVKSLTISPGTTLLLNSNGATISDELIIAGSLEGAGTITSTGIKASIEVSGSLNAELIEITAESISIDNGGVAVFSAAHITNISIGASGNVTTNDSIACQNLTIGAGNTGTALTMQAPLVVENTATIASSFEINDTLYIQNLAYFQTDAQAAGSGHIYIQEGASLVNYSSQITVAQSYTRTWSNNTYAYICMPFPNQINNISNKVYRFNEQNTPSGSGWVRTPKGSALYRGPGYIAFAAGKQEFTGFTNLDEVTIPVTRTESAADPDNIGANLIGNPYTCPLSFAAFSAANASLIEPAIYLWADGGKDTAGTRAGDYIVKNDIGASGGIGSIDISGDNIASMQAFFVRAIASGTLTIDQSMILPEADNTNALKAEKRTYNTLRISASNDLLYNDVLVGFVANETAAKLDAEKKQGNSNFAFYINGKNGKQLGITALAYQELDSISIPLGFAVTQPTELTIAIEEETLPFTADSIMLINTVSKERHDLFSGSTIITASPEEESSWKLMIYLPVPEQTNVAGNEFYKKRKKYKKQVRKLLYKEYIDFWGRKKHKNYRHHSIEIERYSDGTTKQYIKLRNRKK